MADPVLESLRELRRSIDHWHSDSERDRLEPIEFICGVLSPLVDRGLEAADTPIVTLAPLPGVLEAEPRVYTGPALPPMPVMRDFVNEAAYADAYAATARWQGAMAAWERVCLAILEALVADGKRGADV